MYARITPLFLNQDSKIVYSRALYFTKQYHVLQSYTVTILKLLLQMKTSVLKYLRKINLYCSGISSTPHPKSLQYDAGSRALRERKQLTEGHTNAMASCKKNTQPWANRNFRSWNKISSPFIDIQVSNSKVHLHNMYYAALFLSQGSSSWMRKPLWLCCHDLSYRLETPSKREPFICSLTSYSLYLFHTTAHRKGVALLLCAGDPDGALWLSSLLCHSRLYFSIRTLAMVPVAALRCFAQRQQEGHRVTSPFSSFPKSCCWPQARPLPSWRLKSNVTLRCGTFSTRKHLQTLHTG